MIGFLYVLFVFFGRHPTSFTVDIIFTKDPDGKSTNLTLKQSCLTSTEPKMKQPASRVSRGTLAVPSLWARVRKCFLYNGIGKCLR